MATSQMKSLGHIRTKSTPSLSALLQSGALKNNSTATNAHRVLGEINVNLKVAPKDDSEIGKISPGKLKAQKELSKQTSVAPLARPAARPLTAKAGATQGSILASAMTGQTKVQSKVTSYAIDAQPEQLKKVVPKKSTRVLRDVKSSVDLISQPAVKSLGTTIIAPKEAVQSATGGRSHDIPVTSTTTVSQALNPTAAAHIPTSTSMPAPLPVTSVQTAASQIKQISAPTVYEVDEVEGAHDTDDYTTGRSWGLAGDLTNGHTTVLNPRYTGKIQAELEAAKLHVSNTRPVEDIEDECWDTSMVAEYSDDIFSYMRELENRMAPNPYYMDQQTEIQWSMRGVLVDWVVQVHQRFNLLPETLFLTINYIDRFLSCKIVSLGKLQLVGATAIFIAAKYEEVNCPTLSEIIYMVDNGYSADELLKAERFMLSMLQFELGWPGPMSFLRRISKADDYDLETRTLAKYFLEVTIMDERFIGCTPSYLAAGAHCMARFFLQKGDWSQAHVHYSNYTLSQLHPLLKALLDCCQAARIHHRTVYEKYTDRRYKKSSIFVREQLAAGFQLPIVSRGSSLGSQSLWQ